MNDEQLIALYDIAKDQTKIHDKFNTSTTRSAVKHCITKNAPILVNVTCDETNNPPDVIQAGNLVATLSWKETGVAGYKTTDFTF